MLQKLWLRATYRSPEAGKTSPLIYPFLLMTAGPAFAYVFFSHTQTVTASILFTLTAVHVSGAFASLWGLAALLAVILALINIFARKRWAGHIGPFLGVMVWLYALIIYIWYGFWLQAFSYAVAQLFFWIWHYLRVQSYWRNADAGLEHDPNLTMRRDKAVL